MAFELMSQVRIQMPSAPLFTLGGTACRNVGTSKKNTIVRTPSRQSRACHAPKVGIARVAAVDGHTIMQGTPWMSIHAGQPLGQWALASSCAEHIAKGTLMLGGSVNCQAWANLGRVRSRCDGAIDARISVSLVRFQRLLRSSGRVPSSFKPNI